VGQTLVYDLESTGLSPWEDEIICIGVWDSESEEVQVFWEDSEEETVRRFVKFVRRNGFDEVVGFNVSFDNRFVMAKCLKYQIPIGFFFNAEESPYHRDLMQELRNPVNMYSSNNSGGLDDWTSYLFEDNKEEENGDVPRLYEKGEFERIECYCRADVLRTKDLFLRMRSVGLV